jgi:exodeoxyribonuclease V alpha subunit
MENLLTEVESKIILCLSEEQRNVLETIITHRISIITGGPGTGKTTLVKSIARMNRILGRRVCLAAPTGRAARRLAEVTGHKAHTIHKLLEYNFENQSFGKDQDDPIEADIVIIDEVSMVDTVLMHHLLCAIPMRAAIIMVGDAHQLPPVGPGTMLGDMIGSGRLPVFYLNTIFRQAQKSPIIINAHRVRQGELPVFSPLDALAHVNAEFYFIEQLTPESVAEAVVDLCVQKLPDMFGLDPIKDIQVLTPMHKGIAGTINLNRVIQEKLNTGTGILTHNNIRFKIGDKVMHLKNNYQKDVFNGDIGIIADMNKADGLLYVDYDGRRVEYTLDETEELTLAYAISVHKSQGSEYPAVILPLITQHYIMLQRNLLYTAITRAQKHVVIVGSQKAIHIAVKNNTPMMRCSGLADRLKSIIR